MRQSLIRFWKHLYENGKVLGVKKDIQAMPCVQLRSIYLIALTFVLNSGRILSVKSCVTDSEVPDNPEENAAHDLLHAMQRMVNQFMRLALSQRRVVKPNGRSTISG
ncbi:hypothetical protein J4731_23300 [Providencia rettgeri]|nr:hypothetical protein [Providencia rettgeri]